MSEVNAVINPKIPVTPETPTLPAPDPAPKPNRSRLIIISLSILLLLIILAAAAHWWGTRSIEQPIAVLPSPLPQPSISIPIPSATPPKSPAPSISISGINWYTTPKQIAALNLFKPVPTSEENYFNPQEAKYYEVGSQKDGTKIINAYIPVNGPGSEQQLRLLQSPNSTVTVILPQTDSQWLQETLTKELKLDVKITPAAIPELNPPETLTASGNTFTKSFSTGQLFTDYDSPISLFSTPYGQLYRLDQAVSEISSLIARKIILKLPDGTVVPYELAYDFMLDDQTPQASWTDTSYNQEIFTTAFISGYYPNLFATQPMLKSSLNLDNKTLIGTTRSGIHLYKLTDLTHPLTQDLYDLYRTSSAPDTQLSLESYSQKPTHFIWQDSLGDWSIMLSQNYIAVAEMAKPVIYLYPQQPVAVHVTVDAKIRQSDPVYPPEGWQVVAHPNGQLESQGQTYPYLFWDGQGTGYYPDYHDQGVVVPQSRLLSTLTTHLSQLGLNHPESQDFLDFWLDKLPQTPYVRLTWLGTADLEQLAPLNITPLPDTRIRIFLEFEGLSQPVSLKPQTLSAPARHGFTLVEWGGLLRSSR